MSDLSPTSADNSTLPDLIEDGGEVRVLDIILAKKLGYDRPRTIRELIARHGTALSEIAPVVVREGRVGKGQKVKANYLTEAQAHYLVAKSETARANSELIHVVQVFTEFRQGNLVAKDADTQARLAEYEAEREARWQLHVEEKRARSHALRCHRRR